MRGIRLAAGSLPLIAFVAACGSGPSHAAAGLPLPAARYLAIAEPANKKLDNAVDRFRDNKQQDLAVASGALKDQAAIERSFDRALLALTLPASVETVAAQLVRVNETRADLALSAAASPSLAALATFGSAQASADALVEDQVKEIRRDLGLPPPDAE